MTKLFGESLATCEAHSCSHGGIGGKPANAVSQWRDRLGRKQKPGFAGDDDFARSVDVVTHDWLARDQRLWQHACQSLTQAGVNHDVHRAEQVGDLLGRNKSCELKILVQARLAN